jgi:uncharacterized protein (TIGR01370 family)
VVGYLSLAEASPDYTYFEQLQAEGLLIHPSEIWKGNQFIDIRDRRWHQRVTRELVPSVLAKGFNGLFLDTVDSALWMEESNPAKYGGMKQAAIELIGGIRKLYPGTTIVLNRGYNLLPDLAGVLDFAVGESVFSTYDFNRKQYGFVDPALYRKQVEWLQDAQRRDPKLTVLVLDYCDPANKVEIKQVYAQERANGFIPYVASIDLSYLLRESE